MEFSRKNLYFSKSNYILIFLKKIVRIYYVLEESNDNKNVLTEIVGSSSF